MSDLYKSVGKFVWKLGCPSKYDGYRYVIDGVCIALQNGDDTICLRKSIYKDLSEKHKTSARNIERCIRHFISKWWAEHQCGGLFEKRPTNSELICYLVEYIRLGMGACKACQEKGLLFCECEERGSVGVSLRETL